MGYKFNPLTGNFNTTTSGTSVGGASDLSFDDNAKVKLGAGNDLQIYHDGTNSFLDNNTGDLLIRQLGSSGDIYLDPKSGERGL